MHRRISIQGLSTFVCFDCRKHVKRHVGSLIVCEASRDRSPENPVPCPACGRPCRWVNYKTEVPPHEDKRRWRLLRDRLDESRQRRIAEHRVSVANKKRERKQELEQKIGALLSRPPNKDRSRLINELRRELARLNDSSSGAS